MQVRFLRSLVRMEGGHLEEAAAELQELAESAPDRDDRREACYALSQALERMGMKREADASWARAEAMATLP
ncbi:MAG: hypothetical protein LC620_01730 [Halobacteriales archaeon]|nr:hypothetical protein [Halobacteriales archaeon]